MDDFATIEIQIPLASIAAIKVAIFLWYHEWRNWISLSYRNIEDQVLRNVKTLPIPKYLQRKVLNCIQSVGFYLEKTLLSLHCMLVPVQSSVSEWPTELNFPKLLCWRNIGTIDKRRTAKKIISCGILDSVSTFRLACFNCIENEIFKAWCESRGRVVQRRHLYEYESREVTFWASYLHRRIRRLMRFENQPLTMALTVFEFGCKSGIEMQNVEFTNYFARKLEDSRRDILMLNASSWLLRHEFTDFESDLFYFAFSHLDFAQKVQIFADNPLYKLPHLLSWPLQDFFLDIAKELYDNISEPHFMILLNLLYLNIWRYKYYEVLEHIFKEFWESSLERHKTYVLKEWIFGRLFVAIFRSKVYEARLGESDLEDRFIGAMFENGHIAVEVLTGYCYLSSFEKVVAKYMSIEPLAIEFRRTIGELRSEHTCERLCHPNRFDDEITHLDLHAARLVFYDLL